MSSFDEPSTDQTVSQVRRIDRNLSVVLSSLGIVALAVLYLFHFAAVSRTAVDLPERDEWVVFFESPRTLTEVPSFDWLFRRHNEHRFVLSRLQVWLLYRVDGWNLVTHQLLNFVLYGIVLAAFAWIARRIRPETPLWAVSGFLVFLLSPLGHVNHAWGIQSQFHFSMLFFPLAAAALFGREQSSRILALGVASGWLAVFSQAGGAAATAATLLVFLVFKAERRLRFGPIAGRRELLQAGTVLFGLGSGLGLWFLDYGDGASSHGRTWPWTPAFWRSLSNQVSYGFGYTGDSIGWGLVCLALVVVPVVAALCWGRRRNEESTWAVAAIVCGVLAILVAIAFGRGALKGPRYFQFVAMLPPFTFLAWAGLLRTRRELVTISGLTLWLVCWFGYRDHWSFEVYRETQERRLQDQESVRAYYHGTGPVPTQLILKPRPVARYLENALRAQISAARRLGLPDSTPPADRPDGGQAPIGFWNLDRSRHEISGWALDPDTPTTPIVVLVEGHSSPPWDGLLGSVRASSPRPEVQRATGYPGDHGFRFSLPTAEGSQLPSISVLAIDSQTGARQALTLGSLRVEAQVPAGVPIGFLNAVDGDGRAVGWALDPDPHGGAIVVHFYADGPSAKRGGTYLGRVLTDRPRLDVRALTGRSGDYGFSFPIPRTFADCREHRLWAFAIDPEGSRNPRLRGSGLRFRLGACESSAAEPASGDDGDATHGRE